MTPKAFHDKCDGKGPTLVLVAAQSSGQPVSVFGGYAGKSWIRGPHSFMRSAEVIDSRDSFVFTISNPFGDGIVRMNVDATSDYAGAALRCHSKWGPVFGTGFLRATFAIMNYKLTPDHADDHGDDSRPFDTWSFCDTRTTTFGDPLRRGEKTFTGAQRFKPLELEVWSVC
jgi:TLD